MTFKQFIRLPAEQPTGPNYEYETIINQDLIDFIVPVKEGSLVGKTLVTLARGAASRVAVAAMYDLDTLAQKIPQLTPVRVYSTGMGKVTGPGLVNMARVVQITEHENFVILKFVDGEEIAIIDRLV